MLLTLFPPTAICSAICPFVDTVAFLFVVYELAIVSHFVIVDVETETMHIVLGPLAKVNFSRRPVLLSVATHFVLIPLTIINCSIRVGVFALPVFES